MSTKSEVSNSASGGGGGHYTMPLYRKLLLSAMLTGNDAAVSFEQLYQVPLLQVLGVPITYVSFTPIVSGPLAMMLMNVLGYLSDKGQHHRQKKVAMLVFNSFLILTGLVILIWANVLMMYGKATGMNDTVVRDNLLTEVFHENNPSVNLSFNPENLSFTENPGNLRLRENPTNLSFSENAGKVGLVHRTSAHQENRTTPSLVEDEFNVLSMPTTALLGLLAFCLLDTGYDLNTAATRACVLACSSRQEHTPLLVMALVMAGAGGCITTLLGTVDTSAILNWGDRMVSQTTVQLIVCCFVLILSLISTAVTALLNIKHLDSLPYTYLKEGETPEDNSLYGTFNLEREATIEHTPSEGSSDSSLSNQETSLSHQYLIEDASQHEDCSDTRDTDHNLKKSTGNGFPQTYQPKQRKAASNLDKKTTDHANLKEKQQKGPSKEKFNFVIACITMYLGASVVYPYNMYAADFLGKVVMGGDSSAPGGSPALRAYEDAMSVAAVGLLVFFCCYMGVSTVHNSLLAFWGLKVDFCVSHGLMAVAIVCLTLSRELPAFYVCCVIYGFQRSSLFSIPFVIANDYIRDKDCGEGERSQVGRAIAVVTCMIPLNYATLFFISGPLITLTNEDSAPLLLASASAFLAMLIFLLYKS